MSNVPVFEYLVAGSTLMTVLPVGCSVGFPSVLLRQLASNDSSIQVDWEDASWIGSIHGFAGIPSMLMPAFMQWRGRKLSFILACLISVIGWITTYTATNFASILISESLQGLGSQSINAVGLLSMSEMLSPRIRTVSMGLYLVVQTFGMALVGIMGSYLHWKTLSLIISAPLVIVTVFVIFMWPESPSWLAYRGEFDKCEKAFTRLRGDSDVSRVELEELILAQKENLSRDLTRSKQPVLKYFWQTLKSRDFYLPTLHMFIFFMTLYWTGALVTIIYSAEIIQRATHMDETVTLGAMILNIMVFVGCVSGVTLFRYYQPQRVFLISLSCVIASLLIASGVQYSQTVGLMNEESYVCVYLLAVFMFTAWLGLPLVTIVAAELMPVKHRGIGGPIYVIFSSMLHTFASKLSPYLFRYIDMWGTWLIYAVNGTVCGFLIWKFVPETKGRTLQQLADYYAYGDIDKSRRIDAHDNLNELSPMRR